MAVCGSSTICEKGIFRDLFLLGTIFLPSMCNPADSTTLHFRLLDVYPSYYGGFICVCWSPDGKYILTGGQDDLVSIWSLSERQIVARCQGHQSWVTAVAFDPRRCDDRTYRFGSVGDDCQLLLWDFGVGMLHRPKAVSQPDLHTPRTGGEMRRINKTTSKKNCQRSFGFCGRDPVQKISHYALTY